MSDNFYRPTKQNKFGTEGNCLPAVIATMFNVCIDDVPGFSSEGENWSLGMSRWMQEKFNKYVVPTRTEELDHTGLFGNSLMMVSIISTNPAVERHMVIVQGDRIVFDPMAGEVNAPLLPSMDPVFLVIGDVRINKANN